MGLSNIFHLNPDRAHLSQLEDYRVVPDRITPLDAPQHPEIIKFAAYLAQLADGRTIADRADINPGAILPFLPHVMILDVIDGGADYRVRVFGTGPVSLMCEERTGMLASEFGDKSTIKVDLDELRTRWSKVFARTFHEAKTIHFKAPTVSPDRSYMHYHGMFAPLTKGSNSVSQIIGIMIAVRP